MTEWSVSRTAAQHGNRSINHHTYFNPSTLA